jgi:hypothetical protein
MSDINGSTGNGLLPEFSVGKVISDTFNVFFKNIVNFLLFGIVAYIPYVLIIFFTLGIGVLSGDFSAINTEAVDGFVTVYLLTTLLSVILGYFVQGAVTYAAIETDVGHSVSLGGMILIGLRKMFPLLGAGLLASLIAGFGFILLVVPGFIALMMLFVTIPSIIGENRGVFEALSRSAELTKGYRWSLLGASIVAGIVYYVVTFVLNLIAASFGEIVILVVTLVSYAFSSSFFATLAAMVYTNLRAAKEGVDTSEIASVFE